MSSKKVKTILSLYFEEIGRHNLLTHEQEIELGKRIEAGDIDARKELVNSSLRFVVFIAKKYQKKSANLTLLGLINEGNAGLVIAAERYDWRKGTRFITYAEWWIKNRIIEALKSDKSFMSLDAVSEKDANDLVEDKKSISLTDSMPWDLIKSTLKKAISHLRPKQKEVMSMLYGLEDGILRTHKEVALKLNVSKNAIQVIKNRALKVLRKNKEVNKLEELFIA